MRVRFEGHTLLARRAGDYAVVIAEEPRTAGADVLRQALVDELELSGGGDIIPLAGLEILAPLTNPSKIVAVGLNYPLHVDESNEQVPSAPVLFAKFPSAIIGPGEPIRCSPATSEKVDYEAEVGLVIGRTTRNVPESDAMKYVAGLVPCNDVSARDAQFADGQWIRGKSYDTFLPVGPAVVTLDELPAPLDLSVQCWLNGVLMQDGRTSEMIFPFSFLVAYASRFFTLHPGDLILTGTPSGAGFARTPPVFLTDGDNVEVTIEGIGTLQNSFRSN